MAILIAIVVIVCAHYFTIPKTTILDITEDKEKFLQEEGFIYPLCFP